MFFRHGYINLFFKKLFTFSIILFVGNNSFAQLYKTNMKVAFQYNNKLDSIIMPPKYLEYSINKDKKDYQYQVKCFILIYTDSLLVTKFTENTEGKIERNDSKIYNQETIKFVNYYADKHSKYRPSCTNGALFSDGIGHPHAKDKLVEYSKNEWECHTQGYTREECTIFEYSFKCKLLKFKCISPFKNIKARLLFNKLVYKL